MRYTIKTKLFASFIIALLLFQTTDLKAQTFEEMDYVVINRLYDFLIDYEIALNSRAFSPSKVMTFFYNDRVEVFNDLSDYHPSYLTVYQYLGVYDSIKARKHNFEFYHYNLKLIGIQNRLYYDIIHIELLKEVVDNSQYPENEILEIDVSNVIDVNRLNFTIIYNKFDPQNRFKILKIELADQSLIPSAWHRTEIPDELRFSVGPVFSSFSGSTNLDINSKHNTGLRANVAITNRFAGGLNYSLSWSAGLGANYIKSDWSMKFDSIRDTHPGQDFQTEVIAKSVSQDLSLLYLDLPIGISARYFPLKKLSFTLSAEILPWYLISSDYNVTEGDVNYSGYYTFNNQIFHFTDMPTPYGFGNVNGITNKRGVNMKDFGANFGLSFQVNYQITNYLDAFIKPSWITSLTDLVEPNESRSMYDLAINDRGVINPLIEMYDQPKLSITTIEAGLTIRINNTVKPFIPDFKFKDRERGIQKDKFYEYLVDQIPETYLESPFEKRKPKKINIQRQSQLAKYPQNIRYSHGPDIGIENRFLKTGRTNKIRARRNDIFYFKPFSFELAKENETNPFSINHKVLYDTLNFAERRKDTPITKYQISPITDLHLFVVSKMNEGEFGIRGRIIQNYKEQVSRLGENQCVLYFNETHGSTISELYRFGQQNNFCFDCNNPFHTFTTIENKIQDRAAPPFGFMNELRILISKDFNLERRNINMHFLSGNEDAFITMFEDMQNVSQTSGSENLRFTDWGDQGDDPTVLRDLEMLKQEILNTPVAIDQFKKIYFYLDQASQDSIFYEPIEDYLTITKVEKRIWDNYYEFIFSAGQNYDKEKAILYKQLYQFLGNQEQKKSIRLRNFEFIKY